MYVDSTWTLFSLDLPGMICFVHGYGSAWGKPLGDPQGLPTIGVDGIELRGDDVRRLWAFLAFDDVELHLLTLLQGAETSAWMAL